MASVADEVAEDYRLALEDLSSNMRFEISNLTVIARENTEHALAIADVLQKHILKAPPSKKLPALYVLDSIVKNVGTPYTLYFGRSLFKTFMESYAVADSNVRRKMEEMLKTWKDPVPGSMDMRPVFSHELVRPIENALMKARAATMSQQVPLPGRPLSAMQQHRNTPTPPGMRGIGAPPAQNQQHGGHNNGAWQGELAQYPGQRIVNSSTPQPYGSAPPPFAGPGISVETLSSDIQNLIHAMKAEFSQNPHDTSVQTRLKALLDLQGVMQSTNLPPDQLELIKNKVTELAAVTMQRSSSQNSTPVPGQAGPATALQHHQHIQAPSASVTPNPPAFEQKPQVTLDSLLGPGAMAALMARQASTQQPASAGSSAIRSPQPNHTEAARQQPQNTLGLLDQLRQAGMLPNALQPAGHQPAAALPSMPPSILPPNISSILAAAKSAASQQGLSDVSSAMLNAAALKQQFRPDRIDALYDKLGLPCTQCGRRFKTDDEGRRKKTAHMDWHFRVHQRTTEAEKRGTHRSWYVDHADWLKSRETVDSDRIAAPDDGAGRTSGADQGPKYIPVPDPGRGINVVCPICQERFENKWLDTAQEWVWLDAVLVNNRAYHASCHAEATRDREATPGTSRRTPEPVLGKRKAETGISSPKIRTLKTG